MVPVNANGLGISQGFTAFQINVRNAVIGRELKCRIILVT